MLAKALTSPGWPASDTCTKMPKLKLEQTKCWLVSLDCTIRYETSDEPESRRKTERELRRGKHVGSSIDYCGGEVCLPRNARAAISKTGREARQRHGEELG